MDPQNREPLTEDIREENTDNMKDAAEKAQPVPVYAERAETVLPEANSDELKALALSYARYLAEHNMHPGEPTFTDSVPEIDTEAEKVETAASGSGDDDVNTPDSGTKQAEAETAEETVKPESKKKKQKAADRKSIFTATQLEPSEAELQKIEESLEKSGKKYAKASALMDLHDRLQAGLDAAAGGAGRDFVAASHRITSTYRQSRRIIGVAILRWYFAKEADIKHHNTGHDA
jgi:hypothetical protein